MFALLPEKQRHQLLLHPHDPPQQWPPPFAAKSEVRVPVLLLAANTESKRLTSLLPHLGQRAVKAWLSRTSSSNLVSQVLH